MNNDKDKQAWFDKERRHKLALAIIDKMEKTDKDDFNLIPALNHYIETGDETAFEEYMQFHNIKDLEQKANYLSERVSRIQETIASYENDKEYYEKQANSAKDEAEAYRQKMNDGWAKFNATIEECGNKRDKLRKQIDKQFPNIETPTMRDLVAFAERVTKEVPQGWQRRLFMKNGDKLKAIKTFIILDNGKAVFEVESNELRTP